MSYTKTNWVNNSSPYINATNLNNIENGIKTNETSINTLSTTVDSLLPKISYSNTEQVVGTWTDNKPVYRKVIYIASLPNATTSTIALNISNLKDIVSINGVATNGTIYFMIPSYRADDTAGIEMFIDISNGITIKTGQDRTGFHANIILEYTKTTD